MVWLTDLSATAGSFKGAFSKANGCLIAIRTGTIPFAFRIFFGISSRYSSLVSFRSKFNVPLQIEAQGFCVLGDGGFGSSR